MANAGHGALPDFPGAAERALVKFPAGAEPVV